jgi:oligopeptide/dipeptide ABC transporter ATP-binding protein
MLSVSNLVTEFPIERQGRSLSVRAVDGVSFQIDRGETLGLVGESGCGKSMTALSILQLVPPPGRTAGGSVVFEARDLLRLNERELRRIRGARIGFVFQEPMTALNPVYTVGDQIAESLTVHGLLSARDARARAIELLEAVRVPDAARRARDYPHQLSGGMRQRVLIAAAIACHPPLLIADEPTTALDVTIQAEILDLLRDMRARFGLALVLITHDLAVVADMADTIAVMYAGRIVEAGSVQSVLREPAHPYTRGLLASIPGRTPGARLQSIPGAVPELGALPRGCAFAPRCLERLAVCDGQPPESLALDPGHEVRCYLYQTR